MKQSKPTPPTQRPRQPPPQLQERVQVRPVDPRADATCMMCHDVLTAREAWACPGCEVRVHGECREFRVCPTLHCQQPARDYYRLPTPVDEFTASIGERSSSLFHRRPPPAPRLGWRGLVFRLSRLGARLRRSSDLRVLDGRTLAGGATTCGLGVFFLIDGPREIGYVFVPVGLLLLGLFWLAYASDWLEEVSRPAK